MSTEQRRFTVSITPGLDKDLDEAKKNVYYKEAQSAMIRDLILRGLRDLNRELQQKKK